MLAVRSWHLDLFNSLSPNTIILVRGDHTNSRKKRSENEWANENLSCGFPSTPGIAPGSCSEELWFSYCSSREMPFREWNFVFREWTFEFRELLREHPETLRELREWPFHSESVFPEIGVVPRLLNYRWRKNRRVPPCAVKKTCAVRPVFAPDGGELRAADPSNVQGPVKRNASPGEQSEGSRPRWKPGQEQNPGPENQDNQHMLEQPRRYFPGKNGI